MFFDRTGGCFWRYGKRCIFPATEALKSGILMCMKILLDDLMKARNLTERQVSIMTGLSPSTVHEIRKGSMPRVDTLELLAAGLKVKISDLIESRYL